MEKYTKETVSAQGGNGNSPSSRKNRREATGAQTLGMLIYFAFGALEILLAFRLILKLLGANPSSNFVSSIYNVSNIFVWPFEGIFSRVSTQGAETTAVFEPATLVAIIIYSLVAFGIVKIIQILSGEEQVD